MINRSARFLHLANWIAAVFLAFVLVVQWDEGSPLPARASLTVTAWDGSTALDDLRIQAAIFAKEHRITFGQEVVDFDQRHTMRHLYLVDGDPSVRGSDWLEGGYRDFTQSTTTRIDDFAQLGNRTPVGRYEVFGDAAKAFQLKDFFASHGVSAEVDELRTWRGIPAAIFLALSMMVFFSIAVVGAAVIAGTKSYGIAQLHGLSYASMLLADLRVGVIGWAVSGAAVAAGTSLALALYNGLASFGAFALQALLIDLLLTAIAFAANALVLLLIMQVGIQPALKGELPGRAASAMAYALRFSAVIVTVGTMATALDAGIDVAQRERSYHTYERLGDTSAVSLGNAYTLEDQTRLAASVGAWLRQQDRDRNIVLAGQAVLASADPVLNGRRVLYVNDAFLLDQPIRLAGGGNYSAQAAGNGLAVLVPPPLWDRGEDIVPDLGLDAALREDARGVACIRLEMAGGQEFFTYSAPSAAQGSAGSWASAQAYAPDPVIVVFPSAEGLLSDDAYTAFASAAELLFPSPSVVKEAVAGDEQLQRYVRAVVPVSEQVAIETQTLVREFRLALLTAGLGLLVLAITGIGVVLIYARRNSQLIFVRHVSGWRFAAAHRSLLAVEAAVLAVLIGLVPYQVWSQNQELEIYRQTGTPLPIDPVSMTAGQWATIAIAALVTAGGVLAVLARTHRRVVHLGASEA
ncbi:hypothetical protein Rhe02_95840 [Rhizocola hellebori]|uniref:Uncharacterized protein n=1 Tax=Rhizocola hellebori TaxID=1392758 RepID=A0A8J3VMC6_9ACTN|nr:hypothetical protein [Rhizocola hellebori]GIH11517.1 hypothetical protein Rhe02_95840 [Rhizocola hellebori]